ncbi:hypothetical protein D1BOALGB6SA_3362 [Olavius sp. associated proteobacterium Delta 1]|nr:hypothetical protein D1BOALGB6SA_3362 [Olavius sp. associated proteobacterium Delta 1]
MFRSLIGGGAETPLQFCAPFSLAANIRAAVAAVRQYGAYNV